MKIPFELNGKQTTITFKELIARTWPFGKWNVIFRHPIDGESLGKQPITKLEAVNTYIMFQHVLSKRVVRIKKIGGFLNGIEFEPNTTRKRS